ncbi:AI-2E family transporter [Halobaculum marinum]|uniref:AI-2E family transporter n=1 Tax=Halobaculum marinum TaxID=3031996 RepID=A0ABD5X071_9EURY|nr:AI-2E family transporter [Halobaculum sp. DT55]
MQPSRRTALAALLAGLLVVTAAVLESVLSTVVFAITVAYVLYPLRQWISARGYPDRVAAGTATVAGFLGVVALAAPLSYVLYRRRRDLLDFFATIPAEIVIDLGSMVYVVETDAVFVTAQTTLRALAISLAGAAPVIALKLVVFGILVYGLLLKPRAPRVALLRLCPGEYHDVLLALHRRTASTLRAIYVLQGATAVGTFVVALATFAALGYQSPFALAVVAGVLQFVPVLGPSVVVVVLAVVDLVAGDTFRAMIVFVVGLILIGFVPDAVIRPRLAGGATDLPVSVYFVGFVGGLLTLGAIGFVVGPLVVALLAETVSLLSQNGVTTQQQLLGSVSTATRGSRSGGGDGAGGFPSGGDADHVVDGGASAGGAGDGGDGGGAGDSAETGDDDGAGTDGDEDDGDAGGGAGSGTADDPTR